LKPQVAKFDLLIFLNLARGNPGSHCHKKPIQFNLFFSGSFHSLGATLGCLLAGFYFSGNLCKKLELFTTDIKSVFVIKRTSFFLQLPIIAIDIK